MPFSVLRINARPWFSQRRRRPLGWWATVPVPLLAFLVVFHFGMGPIQAATGTLERFLHKVEPAKIFPEADEFGPPAGDPPGYKALPIRISSAFIFASISLPDHGPPRS